MYWVDETSVAKGLEYITLFVDIEQQRTVHISDGKDHQTAADCVQVLEEHQGHPDNIEQVSCDMSPAFIKGARESLPKAQITFDKFHIMKIINDAVDQVRREEAKTNPLLKGARYAVLKNDTNLTAKQKASKETLCLSGLNLKTVRAMQLRETFQQRYTAPTAMAF